MYQHILLALDTAHDNRSLLKRAYRLAQQHKARLTLLHVVDFIPADNADTAMMGLTSELPQQLLHAAKQRLDQLCQQEPAPNDLSTDRVITIGAARHEIINEAQRGQCDLIVVGHHPHRGLGHLLGHTDESVLHHACCDVLAFNLSNQ